MMGKGEPYCTISVPNVETAAYLMALMNPGAIEIYENSGAGFIRLVSKTFQGGAEGLRSASEKIFNFEIWNQLQSVLRGSGSNYTETSAPWCNPYAPVKINGHTVICKKAGLKLGCVKVSLEELKLLLEKCEQAEE